MTRLTAPIRLRAHLGEGAHKVSWLELFFDLVFVAAVTQVAEPLHDDYSFAGVLRFATLFALIWWAWAGYTVFATRFHADDGMQRSLRLLQVFVAEPYLELRWQVFVDGGKTFDRARVFEQGNFHVDIGAGFKIETQTRSFNLTYGRSLRDGTGALGAYVQQRW